MSDELKGLEDWLATISAGLSPPEMRALGKRLALADRRLNVRRIHANRTPEGAPMEPRKAKSSKLRDDLKARQRSIKRKLMFQRATRASLMRAAATADGAQVGWVGAMARIMRVHHYGLVDHVTRDAQSPAVKYAARPLLGTPPADREELLDIALEWLAERTRRR